MASNLPPATNMMRAATEPRIALVREKALSIRRRALTMAFDAQLGHPGGDMSVTDILATIYFGVLRFDPERPRDPARDRFILSKGHCPGALYATLAEAGFMPFDALATYMKPLSRLNGHPNRNYVPGIEANTGPLGHGLPIAIGISIAGQMDGANFRTFVVTGDGELQEGSNWEAAMTAGNRKLANLTLVIDRNRLQQGATVAETNDLEPLADKWRAFGWDVVDVDGHDHTELLAAFARDPARCKPLCVIAHTIKGRGVSFMENQVHWHHGILNRAQYDQAMNELQRA